MIVGITGADGFIGKLLANKHIERGDQVRVLTRKYIKNEILGDKVSSFTLDLVKCSLEDLGPFVDELDVLYNCAGEIVDESLMFDLHVNATKKLITAAENNINRWVQISTVGMYETKSNLLITEDSTLNPTSIYQKTKLQSDELLLNAAEEKKFEVVIVRPGNVFGPSMKNSSFYGLIESIRDKKFFYIGYSHAVLNYIDVENVIHALMLCSKSDRINEDVYIISDTILLNEFVDLIKSYYGLNYNTYTMPISISYALAYLFKPFSAYPLTESRIKALTNKTSYSTKKIRRKLGYEDVITVKESILKMCKELSRCEI